MTTQPQLTEEETKLFARTVVMAGIAVAVSKWSGNTGTMAELEVIPDAFFRAARERESNPLLQSLVNNNAKTQMQDLVKQLTNGKLPTLQEVQPFTLRRCDELAELLDSKASPTDAAAIKQTIVAMCQRVAEESKEGDFLGFGGARISPEETATISAVARALKLAA